jgi:hypothetical protein
MSCCRGQDYDRQFGGKAVRKELRAYRRRGPRGATGRLLRLVKAAATQSPSLLDIGGGVGVIPQELLKAGASQVTSVDASDAYVAATRRLAHAFGYQERWTTVDGDFVERFGELPPADIVTLDKVICCYPDMPALVSLSAGKARKLYGIVVPKDRWWVRVAIKMDNIAMRLRRCGFQGFVHPLAEIDALVEEAGLRNTVTESYWIWSVRLYVR